MSEPTERDKETARTVVADWTSGQPQPYPLDGLQARIAQAIADAREAENRACEEVALFRLKGEAGGLRDALLHAKLDIAARRGAK